MACWPNVCQLSVLNKVLLEHSDAHPFTGTQPCPFICKPSVAASAVVELHSYPRGLPSMYDRGSCIILLLSLKKYMVKTSVFLLCWRIKFSQQLNLKESFRATSLFQGGSLLFCVLHFGDYFFS